MNELLLHVLQTKSIEWKLQLPQDSSVVVCTSNWGALRIGTRASEAELWQNLNHTQVKYLFSVATCSSTLIVQWHSFHLRAQIALIGALRLCDIPRGRKQSGSVEARQSVVENLLADYFTGKFFIASFDPHVIVGGAYKSIGSKDNSACGSGSGSYRVTSLHLKRYTVFARSDASATHLAQLCSASIREQRLFAKLLWTAWVLVPIAYTLAIRDTRMFKYACATRMY